MFPRLQANSRSTACFLIVAAMVAKLGDAITTITGQPHIVVIIADDLGWNDVGFHGSNQIPTPNIDSLCYNGILLNNYYTNPTCTPSRASLMTGKYPIKLGLQGPPLSSLNKGGLPLTEKILPEYLKDLGYSTYAVGKWHLGMSRTAHMPTYRGFDAHFGYRGGITSYYDFLSEMFYDDGSSAYGFDLYRNQTPSWEDVGTYATDLYTREAIKNIRNHDPRTPMFLYLSHLAVHAGNEGKNLEAPQETVQKLSYIVDGNRRSFAAMVSKLDESVGKVVQALKDKSILDNSIIVFVSDNGAPSVDLYRNWGSNYPLRGIKATLWEGAVRVPACMWNRNIRDAGRVSQNMIHVSDWLPTLVSAAGGYRSSLPYNTDGINQWHTMLDNGPAVRYEFLLNIDEKTRNAAYRQAQWKMVLGQAHEGDLDDYYGETGSRNKYYVSYDYRGVATCDVSSSLATISPVVTAGTMSLLRSQATIRCPLTPSSTCQSAPGKICLFDIEQDPCELTDLSKLYPHIVRQLKSSLVYYKSLLIPQISGEVDRRGDPSNFNFTYKPWLDNCIVNCV